MKVRLRVKEVADARGVNMTQLSHRAFVSFNTVKSMFRNPYRTVNTDTLARIATALDVSVHSLIEEVPDEEE